MAGDAVVHGDFGGSAPSHARQPPPLAETGPASGAPGRQAAFLSTVIAGRGDRRLALIVVLLSALGFVVAIPYAKLPLTPVPAFIPAYEAALFLCDAVTAVMLFGQFRWSRSPALLVLGAGYVYDALLTVAHVLTFPGTFAPAGLLGAGMQTTAWLYMLWHGGFPLFLIGYALVSAREAAGAPAIGESRSAAAIGIAVAGVAIVSAALAFLAVHADALLPAIMTGNTDRAVLHYVVACVWIAGMAAIVVLWRKQPRTVLDLWLIAVASVWVFDVALSAVFDTARFDLGFYAGRAFGLMAASFVLGVLLVETGGLHSRLAAAKALLDDYARTLETRVRERTAELARSNETLVLETAERRKAEAQLYQAQKMEALGQLTGGLAHDFNNHLGIIIGNLDMLGELLAGERKEFADEALAAALKGAELTRRLLAFARRQPLQPERIAANDLIAEITKLLSRTLGERITVNLSLDPAIPCVVADPAQLETAIANLANNARDAMPEGGVLTITTGTRHLDEDYAAEHAEVTPGPYVMIEVSDTGCGMPPETLARVFEPFFTTKPSGEGTGLGLSMVFGFLKQSGGHINAYSEPGKGTTFRLYLRPDDAAADAAAAAAGRAAAPAEAIGGTGEHILVVEDNIGLRRVLVRQLDELGYRVIEAENAADAIAIFATDAAIDLLLTDVVMPGELDGCALARVFIEARPAGKVVLTSGFPGTRLASADGIDTNLRLLTKPYRRRDLALLLREALADSSPAAAFGVVLNRR